VVQAVDSMRKGATSTVRALTEQTAGIELVARETDKLLAQFNGLGKSMSEQAKSSQEIAAAANDLDLQARQASKAMEEQVRGFGQLSSSSANITKQIKSIATANLENSQSGKVILGRLEEVRQISLENTAEAGGVATTLAETSRDNPSPKPGSARRKHRPKSSEPRGVR
jgi:methyl-accepting chemotaxis protein